MHGQMYFVMADVPNNLNTFNLVRILNINAVSFKSIQVEASYGEHRLLSIVAFH